MFEQENYDGKLLFTIYRWKAQEMLETALEPLLANRLVTPLPVRVGRILSLLGCEVNSCEVMSGDDIRLTTYWRVLARPDQPLSLMAHLVGPEGWPVAVGDALGVPVEGWRTGDIIAQTHRLRLDPTTPPGTYQLLTGAYWLPEVDRIPASDGKGRPVSDNAVPLTTIEVGVTP